MKPEEAIERINDHIEIHQYKEPQAIHIAEALQMAVEALEKQIPKESTESVWNTLTGPMQLCPVCGNALSRAGKYCRDCGQRVRV